MNTTELIPGTSESGGPRVKPPAGTVRAGEIAKEFRVTTQAVGEWARERGCPVEFVDENGGRWFVLAKVRSWVSANCPRALAKKNGGGRPKNRKGAGGQSTSQGRGGMDAAPLLHEAEEEGNRQQAIGNRAEESGEGGKVSAIVFEKTRLARVQAEQKELDLAKSRGELLNRNKVEAAIVSAARNIGGLCTTMSQRLASEIVGRASLPAGMFPVIEEMIRLECDGLVDAMLSDPLGDAIAVGAGNPGNEARAAA